MHSVLAFLVVAAVVTLTPGPAFALLVQVAAAQGWRAAFANIVGNSVGVLTWGCLAAVGVSTLITANYLAYEALRLAGAVYLIYLGGRALLARQRPHVHEVRTDGSVPRRSVLRATWKGMVNSLANPKLAVFFVALFPQFLAPGSAVLP